MKERMVSTDLITEALAETIAHGPDGRSMRCMLAGYLIGSLMKHILSREGADYNTKEARTQVIEWCEATYEQNKRHRRPR